MTPGTGAEGSGRAWGRGLRQSTPRGSHADFEPSAGRPDPVALLESANEGRVAGLIPIRFGRMSASPFGFFQGAAALMAYDLGGTPVSGIEVQLCGDAHLSNFGLYATPERRLVFGVNDFDETMRGPWEWDVKRLAASLVVAARDIGLTRLQGEHAAIAAACSYRERMGIYAEMGLLDLWYATVDVASMLPLMRAIRTRARKTADRAVHRDHLRALNKLTEVVGDVRRIRARPTARRAGGRAGSGSGAAGHAHHGVSQDPARGVTRTVRPLPLDRCDHEGRGSRQRRHALLDRPPPWRRERAGGSALPTGERGAPFRTREPTRTLPLRA
jgi:hypothetical protein